MRILIVGAEGTVGGAAASALRHHEIVKAGRSSGDVRVDLAGAASIASAAIEMLRGIRINVVSPGLLEASAKKYDGLFPGHEPVSSKRVGLAYVKGVDGALTGKVITVG